MVTKEDKIEEIIVEELPPAEVVLAEIKKSRVEKESWQPKTELGKKVKSGEITDIDEILDKGYRIMEAEIVDILVQNLETDLFSVGQSKGKFGGGKRSIWKQTQKKTKEGNKPKFATMALVGDKDGHVGIGYGKAKETVPAREKAIRAAKLNIIKIRRGCGSWACSCATPHSIPFKVTGKTGSTIVNYLPAPKGTHLAVEKEVRKLMEFAGIKDLYSKSRGQTRTKINLLDAAFKALKSLSSTKIQHDYIKKSGLLEGSHKWIK